MSNAIRCVSFTLLFAAITAAQSKERTHEEMLELAREIRALQAQSLSTDEQFARYQALRASLGGDDPAHLGGTVLATPGAATPVTVASPQSISSPLCVGQTPTVTTFTAVGPYMIPAQGSVGISLQVSGVGAFLADLDPRTYITHSSCGELRISLQAPTTGLTPLPLCTNNGGSADDVYNGTLWDDSVHGRPVTEFTFTDGVTASPLNAEGSLAAFCGQSSVDPNGSWFLIVEDNTPGNSGSIASWELTLTTLPVAPALTTRSVTIAPNLPIPDAGTITFDLVVTPQMFAPGTACVSDIGLFTEITHTFPSDLDMVLISPSGTTVLISSDNGGSYDNAFNGANIEEIWIDPITDHPFNALTTPGFSPEGAFANFKGEDPVGTWRLSITDDTPIDTGSVQSLRMWIFSAGTPLTTSTPYCTPGISSAGCAAQLSGQGFPSASAPDGFTLRVQSVDGQKQGGLWYGINGQHSTPWGVGGTSIWCVRLPVQRLGLMTSLGTAGACDGAFALDWNAWMASHPDALGQPLAVGQVVDVQAWYRDSPAPKTSQLSDALEFIVMP